MTGIPRSLGAAVCAAAGLAIVLAWSAQSSGAQTPRPQPTPQQTPQQTPVFRASTNAVQVDAYPTRDGRIIEGLTAKDFQVFEDGKPQTIETADFIRIEPNAVDSLKVDPNTQEEGNRLAQDPRNRVFVIFLDHYHSSLAGSYSVARPVVTFLNRLLTPGDLFGVATPVMRPSELILGRRVETIEDQLQKHWTWGWQNGAISLDPEEEGLVRCYGEKIALDITARTREDRTLNTLGTFVDYLGKLREARKALILFSRGWRLYEPDLGTLNSMMTNERTGQSPMGVNGAGQLSITPPNVPGYADWKWCAGEADRAYRLDNRRRFNLLIDQANRANVAFYPVNTDGVASGARPETLLALAENTDGISATTNDFNAGLRKIADDLSAYYLLTYSPTNTKNDGAYRRIDVKVNTPGVRIKARRGYIAPGAEPKATTGGSAGAPAKAAAPSGVTGALDVLSRLRVNAELFTYGIVDGNDLAVGIELPQGSTTKTEWQKGADVQVSITGDPGAPAAARIEAGTRGVVVRMPKPAGAGPFRVNVKVTGAAAAVVSDRIDVNPGAPGVLGEPIIYRAAPAGSAPLRAAADFQFWKTERVHVEFAVTGGLDSREGRVLARDGSVVPVPVQITEKERDGKPIVAADVGLAALAAGDYVLEVIATQKGTETKKYVPIRVVR